MSNARSVTPSITSLLTFVLWVTCASVGVLGLIIPYSRPRPQPAPQIPIRAEILNVQLEDAPSEPESVHQNPSAILVVPPLVPPNAPPPAPALVAVADVRAPVAFALPIEGPVQIVSPQEASYVRPEILSADPNNVPVVPATPQRLTYGLGEGRQPAPEYPRRAMSAGQEGTVVLRFSVGENGRVLAAEAASPCPWPLLNEAALRVVRERWRFRPGETRLYEVAIHFQLEK
jgi:periplasmic protein TonB